MYLVTGCAGFIGSNIVAALAARGEEVVVCDWVGQDERWQRLRLEQARGRSQARPPRPGWPAAAAAMGGPEGFQCLRTERVSQGRDAKRDRDELREYSGRLPDPFVSQPPGWLDLATALFAAVELPLAVEYIDMPPTLV
jgi:hypothetical protein